MATTNTDMIRAVAFREGDSWIAQCLEYDICAQGDTSDDAMRRLEMTMNSELGYTLQKHGVAFAGIDAAPQKFVEMFEEAEQRHHEEHMEWAIAA